MVCNFCGKENADDAVFCKSCGNRLVSEESPEELYTENISEEEYAESEEYASYAADNTENSVIVRKLRSRESRRQCFLRKVRKALCQRLPQVRR